MAPGRIQQGFHWAPDGVDTAQLPDTRAKCRSNTFWKVSATLGTPAVAHGRRRSGVGTPCDSRSWLRLTRPCVLSREVLRRVLPLCLFSRMFADQITDPPPLAI